MELRQNFIDDRFVGGAGGERIPVLNPARDTVISEIPDSTPNAATNITKVNLEPGGKVLAIVVADADLDPIGGERDRDHALLQPAADVTPWT